ncbi:hypothetical protein VZQ01_10650 [Myxococcus faecalis]|uniref:hypothetical protein n=1 Tax=Myxococcus faecalis TaxID=3115646 RepID=UPI0038CFDA62
METAKALVAAGGYEYDSGKSCMQVLLEELASMVEAVEFIEAAFTLVTSGDYFGTIEINTAGIRGVYDEYAFSVSEELFEKFGLRKRNWYLKFKITEVRAKKVFVLSLHPLYKLAKDRIAGPLGPG